MFRFYLPLICGLFCFSAYDAQAQAEPEETDVVPAVAPTPKEDTAVSEIAELPPVVDGSAASDLSIAPAALSQPQPHMPSPKVISDTELFNLEELDFKTEDGAEVVYLEDGTLFSGAVKIPDEQYREIIYFYKNGKKDGTAISYDDNHNIRLEISYKNGLKNGVEMLFYPNGKPQYQKTYKDDRLNGEEILFFESGQPMKRSVYADNVLNGEVRTFTEDGNLAAIQNYKNGIKEGVEQIIENNRLKQENVYVNGKLDGVVKKFNEKYLIEEIPYKNGLQEGVQKIYSEKGSVSEIPYVAGKRNGTAVVYYPDKKPAQKVQYANDMKNGLNETFRKDGSPLAIENYKDDKSEGLARYFDKKGDLSEVKYYVDGAEMATVNLETDTTLKKIYDSYKQDKFGKYSSKRNLWYTVLWLALNTGKEDMLAELEKEMKMYALSLDDMIAYQKYSDDYEDVNRRLYFGLTPFGYAVNLSAPTEFLQHFVSQTATVNPRGTTSLQEAIRLNKADMVQYILQQKTEQNFDELLFYALKNNAQPTIIEMLLQQKADVRAVDENAETPLLYALKHQPQPETILLLLKAGANADATDNKGNTPFFYAVQNQMPLPVLRQMLQSGASLEATDKNGDTALLYAVKQKFKIERIADLLQLGANTAATAADGSTPLTLAIAQNRDDLVELLIKSGTDLNKPLNTGTPILSYAYQNNAAPEIMQILLTSDANINLQDSKGDTLLLMALRNQDTTFAQTLLNKGADVNLANADGESALTYALTHPIDAHIRDAILAQNADLNQKIPENNQMIVWRHLLRTNDAALIKTAFDNVRDIAKLKDDDGFTPVDEIMSGQYAQELRDMILSYVTKTDDAMLKRALKQSNPEVLKQVLDLNKEPQNLKIDRENLLFYIIRNRLNPAHLDVLAQIGIDFDAVDTAGQTALGKCILANKDQYVPYLLKHGADVNKIISDRSYLMNLQENQTELTALLLAQNPDISHITQSGETVLMAAAKNKNKPLVEYLLKKGADIDAEDSDGNNTLMYLASASNTVKRPTAKYQEAVVEIASVLLRAGIDVNHRNINGETALILFAKHNAEIYQAVRSRLVADGAETDLKDQYGKTADDYFALNSKK